MQKKHCSRWKTFEVRATYVPTTDQRDANLVRDGIIELGGERRGLGNQVALRGIFAKVLSKNRPLKLITHSLAKQPQLADLEVNQFAINHGWMGIAMAPNANTARIPYHQPTPRLHQAIDSAKSQAMLSSPRLRRGVAHHAATARSAITASTPRRSRGLHCLTTIASWLPATGPTPHSPNAITP